MNSTKFEAMLVKLPLRRIAIASIVATILFSTIVTDIIPFPAPAPVLPILCALTGDGDAMSVCVALILVVLIGLIPTLLLICSLVTRQKKRKALYIAVALAIAAAMATALTASDPDKIPYVLLYAVIDRGTIGAGMAGCLLYLAALACACVCLFSKSAKAPLSLAGFVAIILLSVVFFVLSIAPFGWNLNPSWYGDAWIGLEDRDFWCFASTLCFWIACGATTALALLAQKDIQPQPEAQNPQVKNELGQIKELKGLLDEGAITQEEFDAKKASLLGL